MIADICGPSPRTGAKRSRKLAQEKLDRSLDIISSTLVDDHAGRLKYPLVVLRAQDFLVGNCMQSFEELRRNGHLVYLDDLEQLKQFERKQRIVFFSHEWTSFTEPDHTGRQYAVLGKHTHTTAPLLTPRHPSSPHGTPPHPVRPLLTGTP